MKNKGLLIVIDGLDGSGKSTQLEIISKKLAENNANVKTISFPDYNSPSSALVKMYLAGEISNDLNKVNAYAASSFYGVDRFANYKMNWENDYLNGGIILSGRYTTSNAIHQMAKLPKENWEEYLDWLFSYEYEKLELPAPDLVIFLDMPIEVSQELMTKRYEGDEGKKDIHEGNVSYLENCRKSALYCGEKLNWEVIPCSENGKPLSIDKISQMIYGKIEKLI